MRTRVAESARAMSSYPFGEDGCPVLRSDELLRAALHRAPDVGGQAGSRSPGVAPPDTIGRHEPRRSLLRHDGNRICEQQARAAHPVRGDRRRCDCALASNEGRRDSFPDRNRRAFGQHRPAGRRAGQVAGRVRRRERGALPGGRRCPSDQSRPVHPDDRSGPHPVRPGNDSAGSCQRGHLRRHLRRLVLSERGVQGPVRCDRNGRGNALPQPPDRGAPVALGEQLVLPPFGLSGASGALLRGASGLRPTRLPAQRDARIHPARAG